MDLTGQFEQLVDFLKANHFASGGLVVGFTGVVVAVLRNLPGEVVRYLWRQVSLEVVVRNDTDLFDAVEYWLARKGTSSRTRVFSAKYRFGVPDVGRQRRQRSGGRAAGTEEAARPGAFARLRQPLDLVSRACRS